MFLHLHPPPPSDCTHNGRTYKKGDTFPKGDKCNNYCTCSVIGEVECSQDLSCFPGISLRPLSVLHVAFMSSSDNQEWRLLAGYSVCFVFRGVYLFIFHCIFVFVFCFCCLFEFLKGWMCRFVFFFLPCTSDFESISCQHI